MKATALRLDRYFGWDAPSEEVKAGLVEHRYASTRIPVVLANVVVAAAVIATLSDRQPAPLLLAWLALITLVAAMIIWSMAYYARHRADHPPETWALRFTLGGLANGVAWGLAGVLFFDPGAPAHNLVMVGVICGMTAGQVVASFAIPASTYAFLVPSIGLTMLLPFTHGSVTEQSLAILWLPYLAIMAILTRSAHLGLARSIRLGNDNAQLAASLAAAKERAERLARTKSDFLAVMSHEIRTPMHGMLGIAELLSNSTLDNKQKIYLEHLRGAGEYLSQLLNNILDFSKIDAEKLVLYETGFSLAELVGEVASLFSLQASQKRVALTTLFPDGLPPFLRGDPHRLKQVLVNLLSNAFKFTDSGSVTLEVSLVGTESDRFHVRFRVTDTGSGISPEVVPVIFDPFTQEHPAESHHYGGTGLGLAISKRLVEAMGGQLALASRVGQGSTFLFTLRLAAADGAPAAPPDDDLSLPAVRILLADDAPLNRLVVREFLAQTPCAIDEAENGVDALEKFRTSHYDIVLMDMRMPEMDGLEAVRRIRLWEAHQRRQRAFVVMLTASAFDSDRVAVMAAGCDALLQKPVQKSVLLRLLRKPARHSARST